MRILGLEFNFLVLVTAAFALLVIAMPLGLVGTFNKLLFDVRGRAATDAKTEPGGRRRRIAQDGLFIRVENGEIGPESSPSARYMGGPALLTVDEHSVAVLDHFGHFTRAVGFGPHTLGHCERVVGTIDLRPQFRKATSRVLTRDGMPIAYTVEMEYRLLDDPRAGLLPRPGIIERAFDRFVRPRMREPLGRYHFSQDAARLAVYPLTVQEDGSMTRWGSLVERLGMGEIDSVIAGQDFDDLCLPDSGDPTLPRPERSLRRRIKSEAEAAAARVLQGIGARLIGLRFTNFTFEDEEARGILDQHFENWVTHWQSEMRLALAEGEQRAITVEGGERARLQAKKLTTLAIGILAALKNPDDADVLAMLHALDAMERLPLDQHAFRHMPREVYELLEEMRRMSEGAPAEQAPASSASSAPPSPISPTGTIAPPNRGKP